MPKHSEDAEKFLLAAKRSEIRALERLAESCELVTTVSDLVHQLQRERGISNIYLVSAGFRFSSLRAEQMQFSGKSADTFRQLLHDHYLQEGRCSNPRDMRLLNSIAYSLHGLDELEELRRHVDAFEVSALESTDAFCRLIAGLLSVVFEAADVADDPEVTRLLVALFNFMQAKEFSGQERAWGAIGFAGSQFDERLHQRLEQLQDCQRRSLEVFLEFAGDTEQARWQAIEDSDETRDLNRLRRVIAGLSNGEPIAAEVSEVWYQLATARIDSMHRLEDAMAARLLRVSRKRVADAQSELGHHYAQLQKMKSTDWSRLPALAVLFDPEVPGLYGRASTAGVPPLHGQSLAHSLYDLIRSQVAHIHRVSEELDETRRALTERKLIERAKGVLMRNLRLNEDDAYRTMQQRAMEMNLKLADVAAKIIEIGNRRGALDSDGGKSRPADAARGGSPA
ncbi:nitrate- and nitrite sensing domain-containing protein [Microbulbifer hydrolyticus]|uniref:ANTAR domain-containing protein n=1 Tax=Microbulbifer hydrolyticus TaxID=48074 RepID=A0A6P1T9L1_9GAMM|nr:nitrate- and nitrite sensing domain-containing protein [Microbulbifer hydrolyticus]MBB5212867.1 AmiR/NasT family two-component response regulator [Microbulbifer hydrolyticus]QHQ38343.1 ANTAR domain-containing protein [Microbulbifer hydrolyticus]